MSTLPIEPTERDRERFRDLTKAMQVFFEYDRFNADGQYKDGVTETAFRIWWSVERERQLLQNLNQSQGCKLSEMGARLEKAESDLDAERKRLDWSLEKAATFYEWQGKHYLSYDVPENDGFDVLETDNPRATIDELIAGEQK